MSDAALQSLDSGHGITHWQPFENAALNHFQTTRQARASLSKVGKSRPVAVIALEKIRLFAGGGSAPAACIVNASPGVAARPPLSLQ